MAATCFTFVKLNDEKSTTLSPDPEKMVPIFSATMYPRNFSAHSRSYHLEESWNVYTAFLVCNIFWLIQVKLKIKTDGVSACRDIDFMMSVTGECPGNSPILKQCTIEPNTGENKWNIFLNIIRKNNTIMIWIQKWFEWFYVYLFNVVLAESSTTCIVSCECQGDCSLLVVVHPRSTSLGWNICQVALDDCPSGKTIWYYSIICQRVD